MCIQGAGFEPAKLYAVDLKSTPVDHLGILVEDVCTERHTPAPHSVICEC